MMPTFPRSPLSFRTAGFPQYGCKAGFPSGAFPGGRRLKRCSPHTPSDVRFSSALRAPRGRSDDPALCRAADSIAHHHGGLLLLRPRGPRSGPGYSVPVRHHLIDPIRPTRGHTAISPPGGLYAMPSLCGSALYKRPQTAALAKTSIFNTLVTDANGGRLARTSDLWFIFGRGMPLPLCPMREG